MGFIPPDSLSLFLAESLSNSKTTHKDVTKTDYGGAGRGERTTGNGQRATGNGQRATGNGQRATGNGQRATGNGQRATGNGQRATGNGQRATGNREQESQNECTAVTPHPPTPLLIIQNGGQRERRGNNYYLGK